MIAPVGLPADERRVPLDLTEPSSSAVGYIHSEFNARVAYAVTQCGIIESKLVEFKRANKLLRASYTLRHSADKKYELDAEMTSDPEIREVEDRIAELESELKLTTAVMESYIKIVEAASREISRRENERTSRGD